MATSLLRPPHYYIHLNIMTASISCPPRYYVKPTIMATSLLRPPHYYGHLTITAISLLRPHHYYGNLTIMVTIAQSKKISHTKKRKGCLSQSYGRSPLLLRSLLSSPLVNVILRLRCNCISYLFPNTSDISAQHFVSLDLGPIKETKLLFHQH